MKRAEKEILVLHFSTSMEGGAGIAARRLHEALIANQIASKIFSLNAGFKKAPSHTIVPRSLVLIAISKFVTYINLKFEKVSFFSIFTTGISHRKIMRIVRLNSEPNFVPIVHIHNWYNFLSVNSIRHIASSGIPVVLTLHDQRLLTGGCHYAINCDGFHSGCMACPQTSRLASHQIHRNAKKTKELINSRSNIHLVAPSKWIYKEVKRSHQLQNVRVSQIYNVTNYSDFEASRTGDIEQNFNNRKSPICYLGVASMDKNAIIKGGDIVENLSKYFQTNASNVRVLFLSEWLAAGNTFSTFWSEITAVLVLSRADNSPNVIHEAKLNNLPVIATGVGGIPELLNQEFDLIVQDMNLPVSAFASKILAYIESLPEGNISTEVSESYLRVVRSPIREHIKLYESILNLSF